MMAGCVASARFAGRRPAEFADVNGVIQDIVNRPVLERIPAVCPDPARVDGLGKRIHGFAADKAAEDLADDLGFLRDDNERMILCLVAKGRGRLQISFFRVDGHGALDFFG